MIKENYEQGIQKFQEKNKSRLKEMDKNQGEFQIDTF